MYIYIYGKKQEQIRKPLEISKSNPPINDFNTFQTYILEPPNKRPHHQVSGKNIPQNDGLPAGKCILLRFKYEVIFMATLRKNPAKSETLSRLHIKSH